MGQRFFVLSFLFSILLSAAQAADIKPVITATVGERDGAKVIVSTSSADDADGIEAGERWVEQDLAAAKAENPGLKPEFTIVKDGKVEKVDQNFRTRFADWLQNHYRVSFTIIRFVANATTVTWGLMLSPDISWEPALAVGLTAGTLSAALMYHNEHYQKWLIGSGKTAPQWIRSYLSEVGYLTITKTVGILTGVTVGNSLGVALESVLKTSFYGTLAQGPWDLFIAKRRDIAVEKLALTVAKERGIYINPALLGKELRKKLFDIAAEYAPKELGRITLKTSFKVLAVSMVATGITVASLMGVPLADIGMWIMGSTGMLAWGKTLFDEKQWKKVKQAQLLDCQALLSH